MATETQFRVMVSDETLAALEAQAQSLGFLTANAAAALYVKSFADLPPEKVFEALGMLAKYRPTGYKAKGARRK